MLIPELLLVLLAPPPPPLPAASAVLFLTRRGAGQGPAAVLVSPGVTLTGGERAHVPSGVQVDLNGGVLASTGMCTGRREPGAVARDTGAHAGHL